MKNGGADTGCRAVPGVPVAGRPVSEVQTVRFDLGEWPRGWPCAASGDNSRSGAGPAPQNSKGFKPFPMISNRFQSLFKKIVRAGIWPSKQMKKEEFRMTKSEHWRMGTSHPRYKLKSTVINRNQPISTIFNPLFKKIMKTGICMRLPSARKGSHGRTET